MTNPRNAVTRAWRIRRVVVIAVVALMSLCVWWWAGPAAGPLRLDVGAYDSAWLREGWGRGERASLRPEEARDDALSFYYRVAAANSHIDLPIRSRGGPLRLLMRARVPVRSSVRVSVSGQLVGEGLLARAPWDTHVFDLAGERVPPGDAWLAFALQPRPIVRGDRAETPQLEVDFIELEAANGFEFGARARWLLAALPILVAAFAALVGFGLLGSLVAAMSTAALTLGLAHLEPLPVLTALPRLVPVALVSGLVVAGALKFTNVASIDRRWLSLCVAAYILFHGSVVFFPNHSPPDIDIHARRTADLADTPLEYAALLRYASQLPTASQDRGSATAALGEQTLIPYSPLPYFFYYAARTLGLDLYWALTVLNAALVMLVAPALWMVARGIWGREAAWLATLLYGLDLAIWHHVGRSHAPAVFGGALGTAALLYLAHEVSRIDTRKRVFAAGAVLAFGVLGYSSLAVLFGLFGSALIVLLAIRAWDLSARARIGVASALVVGGVIAGCAYYFHYIPGLLGGVSDLETSPDLFPGREFFIFHNESRQSYRIWVLGYWIPLLAAIVAAPWALWRGRPQARPVLIAWLAAWALIMLLKEPWLFPRMLRWAKEDQFLSPLLCLLLGGAVGALPSRWMRLAAWPVVLGTALWLQVRDFGHHAISLRL